MTTTTPEPDPAGPIQVQIDPFLKIDALKRQVGAALEQASDWEAVAYSLQARVAHLEAIIQEAATPTPEQEPQS